MHLKAISLAILLTTLTAYALADSPVEKEITEYKDRRLVKRDAAIIIDNFPAEPIYRNNPSVVYRKITRRRYNPKPKYGPPKPKYRTVNRKPIKKYKKPISPKYGPPSRKRRPTKPRYGPPKPSHKPVYGPPKKPSYSNYEPEASWDFEAPQNYGNSYEQKPSFGEPPSDYGVPVNGASNIYTHTYEPEEFDGNYGQDGNYENYAQNYHNYDTEDYHHAHSKHRPVYTKPEYFEDDQTEDSTLDPDLMELININNQNNYSKYEKRKPHKKPKKPWRLNKEGEIKPWRPNKEEETKPWRPNKEETKQWRQSQEENNEEDEVLVGGRYAEPPARYVPKFQPSESSYDMNDFSPMHYFLDPDRVSSATMSPYVNYKNSNMAFSPQNLNDAFSIVET